MVTTFSTANAAGNTQTVAPPVLLAQLLNYVVEQAKEINLNNFRLAAHEGFLRQKNDIVDLPGVSFYQSGDGDPVWLRVERLKSCPAPKVQLGAAGTFIRVSQDTGGPAPSIDDEALSQQVVILNGGGSGTLQSGAANKLRASVLSLLDQYIPVWHAWAAIEQPRRVSVGLYGDLFDLKLQLESQKNELVWGMGITAWKLLNGTVDFQYPLLTQSMEIAIEDKTMAILLRPRAVEPRLEFDAFFAAQIPNVKAADFAAKQALAMAVDRPITPFDIGSFEPTLKLIAGNLDPSGSYRDGQNKAPAASNNLLVTDAWVLMSRRRSNNFLIDDAERLRAKINDGGDIPDSALALVTAASNTIQNIQPVSFRGLSGLSCSSGVAADGAVRELYFPLPYNHEQVAIVEQLERCDGVAVQGPPGTGKTYTIANIVCHYLAMGKKVLVTSKGEQALEVLRSKIPESVRPLAVALLSGDHAGMQEFQSSIATINHELNLLNISVLDAEIKALLSGIDRTHSELAAVDNRINAIADSQLSDIVVDGVCMRAASMADLVVTGNDRHGWFDDVLTLDVSNAPPSASAEEFAKLRQSRRRLGVDLMYAKAKAPSSGDLPTTADIGKLHSVLVGMKAIHDLKARGDLYPLCAENEDALKDAKKMLEAIKITANSVRKLESTGEDWPFELRKKFRSSGFITERKSMQALFVDLDVLTTARAEFMVRPVVASEAAIGMPKFREAINRAVKSGKPLAMFTLGAGDIKVHLDAIRVAGLIPSGQDDWKHVQRYVMLHDELVSFSARWNEFAKRLSIPMMEGGVQALDEIELLSVTAREAHSLATDHDVALIAFAERVFVELPADALLGASVDLLAIGDHLKNHLTLAELALGASLLATLKANIADTSGPISCALKDFYEKELGNKQLPAAEVIALYDRLVQEVARIESLKPDLQTVNSMADIFKAAGATKLANRLCNEAVAAVGDDTIFPVSWREAWNWARIKSHLESIEARDALLNFARQRRELETGLASHYENMVAKSAWRSAKAGATPKVLSALAAYTAAMGKIGKGLGSNAPMHRRNARLAMENARGAVPCWIMSHAKVSESLPAELGSFDLVVVDEASQSDIWALPAVLRGKKILVVGDDKQVSPDGGFVAATHVQALRDQFLSNQPFASVLTLGMSLYDLASTVFASHKVVLHEHFRCVPAIIAYSNRFYANALQPIRIPKLSERIDPPLVDIYVPSGSRANNINRQEAEAIAAEISAILLDKNLVGRTLGVVSLLGLEQAKFIDTLVRSRFDAAELMLRKFKCGNASFFQGSERDIMFLTMVVDAKACTALSGNMYDQRFNVAASRARDRMYLVRSVTLYDLSALDIRTGLLQHFSQPLAVGAQSNTSLMHLCDDSPFEREVYSALFDRGYRVVPQVKAGAFRIDMVVEGENDARLAIECDGDQFHGPDQWAADMKRQRVLERAGWTFWRCFASTWTLRKDEVLSELIAKLNAMGIAPLGALMNLPSLVENRVLKPDSSKTDQFKSAVDASVQGSSRDGLSTPASTVLDALGASKQVAQPVSIDAVKQGTPPQPAATPHADVLDLSPPLVSPPLTPVRVSTFVVGANVTHKKLGPGLIIKMNGQTLTVYFPFREKKMEFETPTAGNFLELAQ